MQEPTLPSTATDPDVMDEGQLNEAREYNRRELKCDLLDRAIDLTFLAIFAFIFARPLDTWLQSFDWLQSRSLRLVVLYVLITLLHMAVSFPLSLYSGHILEHRYQLSRQSFAGWLWRYTKRNLITLLLGVPLTLGLFWMIWTTGSYWWIVAAVAYFALSVLMGQLAPVLLLPLFYRIERFDDDSLNQRLAARSAGTGLSIEGVYRMKMSDETAKANALLAGLGRTRRVILGDTLLDQFSPDEIDVIFAHEIGHHVHRHVGKMILAGAAYSVVGFFLCDRALAAWLGNAEGAIDYAQLPVYTVPFLSLVISLFSMVVEPLQNAISRYYERQADQYALTTTGNHQAYRSAFVKLAKLNKADPDPHPLEVFLFHSHPPIQQRIAMAKGSG